MTAAPVPSSTFDSAPGDGGKDAAPLRSRALTGSAWTIGEYLFCNVLRLVTNMVMARLLFPEAFGVMVIAGALVQALEMFADVGVGLSIIQHKRGDEPAFLNTAWTIQVIRGLALCAAACALALPYAMLYDQPVLAWIVPACGLIFVINGLQSTNMATCGRSLNLKRVVALGVAEAIVKSSVMIVWAIVSPSVWALVAGSLITYALSAAASHVMLPGIRNRFAWDSDAVSQMIRFGKWVFLSTALTYLAVSSDRLVIAKLVPLAVVGVGNLAGHAVVHAALRRLDVRLWRQDLGFTGALALATVVGAVMPAVFKGDERMVVVNALLVVLSLLLSAAVLCRGLERVVEPAMRRVARALTGRAPAGGETT